MGPVPQPHDLHHLSHFDLLLLHHGLHQSRDRIQCRHDHSQAQEEADLIVEWVLVVRVSGEGCQNYIRGRAVRLAGYIGVGECPLINSLLDGHKSTKNIILVILIKANGVSVDSDIGVGQSGVVLANHVVYFFHGDLSEDDES